MATSQMAFNACAQIRRESSVDDFIQCLTTPSVFLAIDPADGVGGGYVYMSSNDSFCTWRVRTTHDKVNVVTARRTGPASWTRVWISSGAVVSVFSHQQSGVHIDPDDGLNTGAGAQPNLRCWFHPYAEQPAFETFPFSLGANAWDSFGVLAAAANRDIGYPPRLCRALYLSSNQNLTVNLGTNFVPYSRVPVVDQGGVWVDSWTSVNILNSGAVNATILASWANTPVSLLNP